MGIDPLKRENIVKKEGIKGPSKTSRPQGAEGDFHLPEHLPPNLLAVEQREIVEEAERKLHHFYPSKEKDQLGEAIQTLEFQIGEFKRDPSQAHFDNFREAYHAYLKVGGEKLVTRHYIK